jgi:hypothetical protein
LSVIPKQLKKFPVVTKTENSSLPLQNPTIRPQSTFEIYELTEIYVVAD